MREAARRLRTGGRVISFSSSVVGLYQPTYGVYAATKGGVEAMTHILANEMRGENITVNAIAPGPTATHLFLNGKPQEVIDQASQAGHRSTRWARPTTSRRSSPSWPDPTGRGSTGRCCAPTAASSEGRAGGQLPNTVSSPSRAIDCTAHRRVER